jgi:hypothetical protein
MNPQDLRLWKIVQWAGGGNDLPQEDLAFVEGCLGATEPQTQANACEVLLRCSASQAAKLRAIDTLKQLSLHASEEDYVLTLLIAMLFLPIGVVSGAASLRGFVFRCARSSRWQIRTNAASLLHSLARTGDEDALNLLNVLANDSNDYVRENAPNQSKS